MFQAFYGLCFDKYGLQKASRHISAFQCFPLGKLQSKLKWKGF